MAFLAMDFARQGRRDLEQTFSDAYFHATRDSAGRALLRFYAAYRAAVRGKVEGLAHADPGIPPGCSGESSLLKPALTGSSPSGNWRSQGGGPA